jgi:hypothetical protein
LTAILEEVPRRLHVLWDEWEVLQHPATLVCGPVLGRPKETPPLVVALSVSIELIEGRVNAVAINGVHWGSRLVLTAVLPHFLELEAELELLGSGYNTDLMNDEMENLLAKTYWALKFLSSKVPPSTAHSLPSSPPDSAGEES